MTGKVISYYRVLEKPRLRLMKWEFGTCPPDRMHQRLWQVVRASLPTCPLERQGPRERQRRQGQVTICDLNLRASYALNFFRDAKLRPKLIVDIFHLFSRRKALIVDQFRHLEFDQSGNQIAPNPTYGQVYLYQPPMSVRLGMEVNF